MIDKNKLDQFVAAAKAKGFKDDEIAQVIKSQTGAETMDTRPTPSPEQKQNLFSKVAGGIAGFVAPRLKQVVDTTAGAFGLSKDVEAQDAITKQKGDQMRQLALQARNETDPAKKEALLAEARRVSAELEQGSGALAQKTDLFQKESGITEKDMEGGIAKFAVKKGIGTLGEVASYAIPTVKVAKGAGIVKNILAGMASGAAAGGVSAITDLEDSDEWYKRLGKGAVKGGAVGGALGGVFGAFGKMGKNAANKPEGMINRIFRFNPTDNGTFQRNTGMNAAKELLARDGQAMAGMPYEDLVTYMGSRKEAVSQELLDELAKTAGGMDKNKLIATINEKIANLAPEKGNIGTSGAVASLQSTLEEIAKLPDEIPWSMAQKLKQQLQDAGRAAFAPSGAPTPASQAMADLSSIFKDAIETGVKSKDVKKLNALTQLYSMARDSIEHTMNSESIKISNDAFQKLIQSFPVMAGVQAGLVAGSAGTGAATAGAVGAMQNLRLAYLKPEFQTKMVAKIKSATEKMKEIDGGALAQSIQDALTKVFSNQVNTTKPEEPKPTTAPGMEDVTAGAPAAPEQMFDVKDNVTGQTKQVPASQLQQYGFDETGAPQKDALPSMEDIAIAMVADLAKGGKNMTELTSLAAQVEKVTGAGGSKETEAQKAAKQATATAKSALADLNKGTVKSGPGALIEKFKAKTSDYTGVEGDQATIDFGVKIGNLKASIAKARAGTSFTPNEEKMLNEYAPVTGDSMQILRAKLEALSNPIEPDLASALKKVDTFGSGV